MLQSIIMSMSIPEHSIIYVWIPFMYVSAYFHIYMYSVHTCLRLPAFHSHMSEHSFIYVWIPFIYICIPFICACTFLYSIHIYLSIPSNMSGFHSYISAFCSCMSQHYFIYICISEHMCLRISVLHPYASEHSFICV